MFGGRTVNNDSNISDDLAPREGGLPPLLREANHVTINSHIPYYGAHTLSISCTKSVISCMTTIFFSHARLQGSIFSPYCDSF